MGAELQVAPRVQLRSLVSSSQWDSASESAAAAASFPSASSPVPAPFPLLPVLRIEQAPKLLSELSRVTMVGLGLFGHHHHHHHYDISFFFYLFTSHLSQAWK